MFPMKLLEVDVHDTSESVPGWFTFFISLTSPMKPATEISYLPIIPAPPNTDVVFTGLNYLSHLSHTMKMPHTIVTAEQAIYDIAYG